MTTLICILSLTSCEKTVGSDESSDISENFGIADSTETDNNIIPDIITEPTTELFTPSSSGITLSYNEAEVIAGQTIQYPVVSETISEVWTSSDENVATVDTAGNITGIGEGNCIIKVFSESDSNIFAEVKVTVSKSEGIQQIDGITYVNGILIVNKTYSLPSTYNPNGLTDETYTSFQELSAAALSDGLDIYISSGFRSYEYQNEIYNNYVEAYGQETADTFSARPGHSEHQTGMAIDVNTIDDSFAGTPEAVWLEEHCIEYGFIIRYPKGKYSITGYQYEPWHIRYVGKEVAQAVHNAAVDCGDPTLTLEEYLNINSVYQ
ncbi:MAG: D-alanyl-D-alanine carboxypeptidase family protein [Ruminococcus sp.]|nr:D-alanyl-D-alanine carboxypeptidase family protein [Ruminococcus sp.]MDE6787917.1 D-alanyl-D-alanine carboxypeptidase family protein [Ruminococcus sp.]